MNTSHSLLCNQRHRTTVVLVRIGSNGNLIDASPERLHSVSVSINRVMSRKTLLTWSHPELNRLQIRLPLPHKFFN